MLRRHRVTSQFKKMTDETILTDCEVLSRNSRFISNSRKYNPNSSLNLVCPATTQFSVKCFIDCLKSIGNEFVTPEGKLDDLFEKYLTIHEVKPILYVAIYLESDVLLNYVCIDRLNTENYSKILTILLNTFGREHFLVGMLLRFAKVALDLDDETILEVFKKGEKALWNLVKNKKRRNLKFMSENLVELTEECPCCFDKMLHLDKDKINRPVPMTCCFQWIHLNCQKLFLKSKYSECPLCQTPFCDQIHDREFETLHSVLNRHSIMIWKRKPLCLRLKVNIFANVPIKYIR